MNSTSRLRVIFVTSVFGQIVNGPGTYAYYLWQHFRDDEDIEFHLVAPHCSASHPRLHSVAATGHQVMWAIQQKALSLAADQPETTVVHGNSAYMMFKFLGYPGPWIAQVNDYEAATAWDSPGEVVRDRGLRRLLSLTWRRRHERRVVRAATKVICNSDYVRNEVVRRYQPVASGIEVIHKAVDLAPFRRPTKLPLDPIAARPAGARLLFIGANWRLKGLPNLLRALRSVADNCPPCHLAIAGPQASEQQAISVLANQLGVADRLTFVGRVERTELPALMWNSDLLVLPTHSEAFGVVILEALAAGLPVIATNVGGIPEIIRSRDEGILVPPRDVESLADAIQDALTNQHYRTIARVAGPARAIDFSVEQMLTKVKQLYLRLAHVSV